MRSPSHVVRLDEETFRVELTDEGEVRVSGLDETFRVHPHHDGSHVVEAAAAEALPPSPGGLAAPASRRRWRVLVAGSGDRRQVFVNGEVYDFQVEPGGRRKRTAARAHSEQLTVPMPARVVKVFVSEGQAVRRGDVLVTLEAMKMQLPLKAPRDGTVRAVACREGELVQPGTSVLEIA